jgi:PAS domain S-box-containing protein
MVETEQRERGLYATAAFDGALDAILIMDDDRRYLEANPAACHLLQATREDLLGKRLDDMVPTDQASAVLDSWPTFLQAGTLTSVIEVRRADGRTLLVEYAARANVLPGRHLSVMRDVTERLRLEEERRQDQKLETLGLLTGPIAHEFNNLLTTILGYTTLLLRQTPRESQAHADLEEVIAAANSAATLTRQLLAFGRHQALQPSNLDLDQVLGNLDGALRRVISDHDGQGAPRRR